MAIYKNGFKDIKVELINWSGDDLARQVCCFGQHAEFYEGLQSCKDYSPMNKFCQQIVDEIISGVTFPKFALQGHNVSFSISGISRVCLAQFTREGTSDTSTFFCSASSGTRPLTQELLIPMNIYKNDEWMERYKHINDELEALYVDMLKAGIPFMDARYLMPHCQTIDICYTASVQSFIGSCKKRLDHCIADEVNYLYRKMRWELERKIRDLKDPLSRALWTWLLDKMDVTKPSTNLTYRNDFERFPSDQTWEENAHNDWRKSQWKLELGRIYDDEPWLLRKTEKEMIERWRQKQVVGIPLPATYNENDAFTPQQSVKKMHYYKGAKNDDD